MPEPHEHYEQLLAGAAVDELDPVEQDELTEHLRSCATCRDDAAAFADVVAGLDRGAPALALPRPDLGVRVVAAVARERRASSRWNRGAASVAAAAAAVVLLATGSLLPGALDQQAPREPIELLAAEGVRADADLVAHTWGTELELVVEGLEPGVTYAVSFLDDAGQRYDAGTFLGVGDRPVVCVMNAALLREDVSRLEVTGPGAVVLSSQL